MNVPSPRGPFCRPGVRLALAATALALGGAAGLAARFEAFAPREGPAGSIGALAFTEDGRGLVLRVARGRKRSRLCWLDLDNPLDRWLGARGAVDVTGDVWLRAALDSRRAIASDRDRGLASLVSFEPPGVSALGSFVVLDANEAGDALLTAPAVRPRPLDRVEVRRLSRPEAVVWVLETSGPPPVLAPDGSAVAVATSTGATLLHMKTGETRQNLVTGDRSPAASVAFGADELWLQPEGAPRLEGFRDGSENVARTIALAPHETLLGAAGNGRWVVTSRELSPGGLFRFTLRDARDGRVGLSLVGSRLACATGPWLALLDADERLTLVRAP